MARAVQRSDTTDEVPTRERRSTIAVITRAIWSNMAIIVVLGLFTGSAFIVPTLTPVATTDDWGYTRSVEILLDTGELTIFPVVAATAVFQVLWGALFGLIFGASLGVMRLATVVMVALGGLALYALCRELGVSRNRSALGTAAYLFNPLTFILAYTFMTDPYFTSLFIISTLFYVRGLADRPHAGRNTVIGSVVAVAAFLTRQQGALIPLAVVGYLVWTRRLRPNWAGLRLLLRVIGAPILGGVGYYLWLRFFNEVPDVQESFFAEVVDAGVSGTWTLVRNLTFIELTYAGLFAFPIAIALLPGMPKALRSISTPGWILICAWEAVLVAGVAGYWVLGRRMPFVGQFVGSGGLGPPDVRGSRPVLIELDARTWLTIACVSASFLVAVILCRGVGAAASPQRTGAGLVFFLGLGQVAGILPPSYHYLNRGFSLDRYLLPLVPILLCLLLWAARDLRLFQPAAWVLVAAFAAFSVAGTRDYLVYLDAVWDMAHEANDAGVPNVKLDAGAAWDGYHLYTYGLDNDITRARTRDGPWWLYFYGKATDSTYVVSGTGIRGYVTVRVATYSSWLQDEPTRVLLLRRIGAPWPPLSPIDTWSPAISPDPLGGPS